MSGKLSIDAVDVPHVTRLAELCALKFAVGDVVALRGDLGAGKTTFARAFIRAILGDPGADVPSPTFPIVQRYESLRFSVSHFDLYRLQSPDELEETGFFDACRDSVVLVEWPERAGDALPEERLDIHFETATRADERRITFDAQGRVLLRLKRVLAMDAFLAKAGVDPDHAQVSYLQGDASARAYARIRAGDDRFVLMDAPRMPDGPPVWNGLPYSQIAHLAEDVRPFVAVGHALAASGVHVPRILASDLDAGLVLLEDLGDRTFGRALDDGGRQDVMIEAAVDVLLHLRQHPVGRDLPLADGAVHRLPRFDRAALEIELALILEWYWPAVKGAEAGPHIRDEFVSLWSPILDEMLAAPEGVFLRDYHSPNLFWLPEHKGIARVGVIDFQDALAEPWAYDLASLLQDARVDVPAEIEARELARYCREVGAREADFDADAFRALYAMFGAQRNTRLVGLWVRLLRRDDKPGYMRHMPRTWAYLERNLCHPRLAALAGWYDRHFPEAVRKSRIDG